MTKCHQLDFTSSCEHCQQRVVAVVLTETRDGKKSGEWLALPTGWVSNAISLCADTDQTELRICCPNCIRSLASSPHNARVA